MRLLGPLLDGRADAVYGSRFTAVGERRVLYFWHSLANHFLTGICNVFTDLNLTDMETCYKAFRTTLLKSIPIRSQGFGFGAGDHHQAGQAPGACIFEVPISYNGRTYDEGKKIGMWDAFEALWLILRFSLSSDIYKDKDKDILDAFADAPNFNRWIADTIRPYVGKEVLEIGAGIGNLTRQLVARKTRYVATDLDLEHLERLRARVAGRPQLEKFLLDASRPTDFAPVLGAMDIAVVCLQRSGAHQGRRRRLDEYPFRPGRRRTRGDPRSRRTEHLQLARRRVGTLPAATPRSYCANA